MNLQALSDAQYIGTTSDIIPQDIVHCNQNMDVK